MEVKFIESWQQDYSHTGFKIRLIGISNFKSTVVPQMFLPSLIEGNGGLPLDVISLISH